MSATLPRLTHPTPRDPTPWQCWREDLRRCGGWRHLWREASLWAIGWYRLGCGIQRLAWPVLRRVLLVPWWVGFRVLELLTGVSLPLGVHIGPGLRIWHFGGIFVRDGTRIGAHCTLRQGVTLGNRGPDDAAAPCIGDDVEFGAYAQVLGPVHVGSGARVGALSVVLHDVPPGCTAVGSPARVVGAPVPDAHG